MERMEEMEAKILSSINDVKNEMNGIKTEQNEMKKQITIEQVFSHLFLILTNCIIGNLVPIKYTKNQKLKST